MKTKIEKIVFFLFLTLNLNAQNGLILGERLIIGNSLTYIWETNDDISSRYNEFTWNKNISINLTPTIYAGLSYQNIRTKGSIINNSSTTKNYQLIGAFFQYDFLPKMKNKLVVEASWNYGNFCTCGNEDPYKENGLNYIGIGGGYEVPLSKIISLDLSFIAYNILEEIDSKYSYTQYIIGLNFDLINKRQ